MRFFLPLLTTFLSIDSAISLTALTPISYSIEPKVWFENQDASGDLCTEEQKKDVLDAMKVTVNVGLQYSGYPTVTMVDQYDMAVRRGLRGNDQRELWDCGLLCSSGSILCGWVCGGGRRRLEVSLPEDATEEERELVLQTSVSTVTSNLQLLCLSTLAEEAEKMDEGSPCKDALLGANCYVMA